MEINTIKSKWNSLRAQHETELAKEGKQRVAKALTTFMRVPGHSWKK